MTEWYVDSGASVYLTARKDWLENVTDNTDMKEIMVANKSTLPVLSSGDIKLKSIVNNKDHDVVIKMQCTCQISLQICCRLVN